MRTSWLIAGMLVAGTVGCRTVWIHPEATQAKFDAERAECRRAFDEARARGDTAPNWKRCMLDQGWTATTAFRGQPAVRTPRETTSKRRGPAARH